MQMHFRCACCKLHHRQLARHGPQLTGRKGVGHRETLEDYANGIVRPQLRNPTAASTPNIQQPAKHSPKPLFSCRTSEAVAPQRINFLHAHTLAQLLCRQRLPFCRGLVASSSPNIYHVEAPQACELPAKCSRRHTSTAADSLLEIHVVAI